MAEKHEGGVKTGVVEVLLLVVLQSHHQQVPSIYRPMFHSPLRHTVGKTRGKSSESYTPKNRAQHYIFVHSKTNSANKVQLQV